MCIVKLEMGPLFQVCNFVQWLYVSHACTFNFLHLELCNTCKLCSSYTQDKLTSEQRSEVESLSGMGFPAPRVARAVLRYEGNRTKVHVLLSHTHLAPFNCCDTEL